MNKADKYTYELLNRILNEGYKDVNPRPHYADGTPAYTISVLNSIREYDIGAGEFPICTLRPIAIKTGIKETMAIYQNQSNQIAEFERLGCGWWKDWALEDGTIGRAYPYNLESHRPNEMKKTVVRVPRRIIDPKFGELSEVKMFEPHTPIDNTVYLERYQVVGVDDTKTDSRKRKWVKIQFVSNNYTSTIRCDQIGKSRGVNPYDRTLYEIGYLGEYHNVCNFADWEIEILKDKWENMFFRCYSDRYATLYPSYDDKFVHQDWHSFEQFLRDVRMLPQYFLAREERFVGWDLDKDYYGSNCYSKDTCVFLKHSENTLYCLTNGCYKIVDTSNNSVSYEISLSAFAEKIGKKQSNVQRSVSKNNKYKNFTFERIYNDDNFVCRYELSRNQLVELLKGLKRNPYSRRHIISFWHWANIDKKSLVECAYETIWNVSNDGNGNEYLNVTLIQRSGDSLTASCAGVNECQYSALLMMVAKHCGYNVGKLFHLVVNEQIYDRHIDQAKEMIHRYEERLKQEGEDDGICPNLLLDTDKTDFFEFTIEDFKLVNYNPMKPQLTLDLGI